MLQCLTGVQSPADTKACAPLCRPPAAQINAVSGRKNPAIQFPECRCSATTDRLKGRSARGRTLRFLHNWKGASGFVGIGLLQKGLLSIPPSHLVFAYMRELGNWQSKPVQFGDKIPGAAVYTVAKSIFFSEKGIFLNDLVDIPITQVSNRTKNQASQYAHIMLN